MQCELDYRHSPIWCPACSGEDLQRDVLRERRRTNRLKEEEIRLTNLGELEKQIYIPPQPKQLPFKPIEKPVEKTKGSGANVRPKRIDE